ncbi:MAG: hypothetical protein AAGB10_14475 [Pseudomonadota bacterium]
MSDATPAQSPIWMGILVAVAILSSFALACGMPFAAIGALAALTLGPRDALVLAGIAWSTNQIIGFGFLGYPYDLLTFAWGAALGISALAAVVGAVLALRPFGSGSLALLPIAFIAAWASQQGAVFLASLVLGASEIAFAPAVLWFIFWTNALAFTALVLVQVIGARIGMARPIAITSQRSVNA